jgi:hypothetical protein
VGVALEIALDKLTYILIKANLISVFFSLKGSAEGNDELQLVVPFFYIVLSDFFAMSAFKKYHSDIIQRSVQDINISTP